MENILPVYERVYSEKSEIRLSSEDNIPEYLPNISKIVKVNAYACVYGRTIEENSVSVSVRVTYSVLYVSDFHDKLKCAVFTDEGSHSFPVKGIQAVIADGGYADVGVCIVSSSAQNTGTRHLRLASTLRISCEALAMRATEIYCPQSASDTEDDSLRRKTSTVPTLEIYDMPENELRIAGTLPLDDDMPGADEVIYTECSICIDKCGTKDGLLTVSGNALINCLYLAGDNNDGTEYISLTRELPFSSETAIPEHGGKRIEGCCIKASVCSVGGDSVRDSYGDGRGIAVEADIKLFPRLYITNESSICEDVFCLCHDCECEKRELQYDTFGLSIEESAEINEKVRADLGSISKILFTSPICCTAGLEVSEGKLWAVGKIELSLTGTNELGIPAHTTCSVPIRYKLADKADTERPKYEITVSVCSADCGIENGEIKCDLRLCFRALLYKTEAVLAVTALSVDESTDTRRNKSEYIIYYPGQNDTVWSVSKKYRVSPDSLIKTNNLKDSEAVSDRATLIIPR